MSGVVVWMTGRSHAGKTTLARHVRQHMAVNPVLLDEDELHSVFDASMPYEPGDGDIFYGTTARLAAMLARQGFVVLVAAAASHQRHRDEARREAPRFVEVFLATPPEAEVGRQPHGMCFASESVVDSDYEPPPAAEVVSRGGEDDAALARILEAIQSGCP